MVGGKIIMVNRYKENGKIYSKVFVEDDNGDRLAIDVRTNKVYVMGSDGEIVAVNDMHSHLRSGDVIWWQMAWALWTPVIDDSDNRKDVGLEKVGNSHSWEDAFDHLSRVATGPDAYGSDDE